MILSLSLSLSSRYLLHSADLSFLEAISQTLTSAQVGIKSEVAQSNSQARDIFQNIDKISATITKVQAKVHILPSYLASMFHTKKAWDQGYFLIHIHADMYTHMQTHSHSQTHTHTQEVPGSTLLAELSEFFMSLTKRTDYLFCHSVQMRGARVGSHPEVAPSPSLLKPSGAPISAVNVTRSILE